MHACESKIANFQFQLISKWIEFDARRVKINNAVFSCFSQNFVAHSEFVVD